MCLSRAELVMSQNLSRAGSSVSLSKGFELKGVEKNESFSVSTSEQYFVSDLLKIQCQAPRVEHRPLWSKSCTSRRNRHSAQICTNVSMNKLFTLTS